MKDFLSFTSIFATEPRKILKCNIDGFEFRCSYKLSNMSLDKMIDNSKENEYGKLSGALDYSKVRTCDTRLSDRELAYLYHDVRGLYGALKKSYLDEDSLITIPLTSTGYVRRDCRSAMRDNPQNRRTFLNSRLSPSDYTLLKDLERGGNTASYRGCAGRLLHNIFCYDEASAYPYVMCCRKFPKGRFQQVGHLTRDRFRKLIECKACMFYVTFTNLKLKPNIPIPYISYSKCLQSDRENDIVFNGRVIEARLIRMAVNEIDFKIIESQYDYDKKILIDSFRFSELDYLPDELTDTIKLYFQKKCELKGVDDYLYAKSKNKLNGIFGMGCTSPVRDIVTYNQESHEWKKEAPDLGDALNKFYDSWNSFLMPTIGAWTTAHARKHLQDILDVSGEHTVYCDTDSDKCTIDLSFWTNKRNAEIMEECECFGAYGIDNEGEKLYMGIYEQEPTYDSFVTWGAKKYAYRIGSKIVTTIAGVNKKSGSAYLKSIGGLSNFNLGLIFPQEHSGRNTAYYDERAVHERTITDYQGNTSTFLTASSIALESATYELGATNDFLEIADINELTFI